MPRRSDGDGRPIDSLGRHRYAVGVDTEHEYGPATDRARSERVTVQWVVQTLTRLYGAAELDLPPAPASPRAGSPLQTRQFWLHHATEHDAAAQRATVEDGITFALAVRRLLRAYGAGEIDLIVTAVDRRPRPR
ncbi:hypothetical protein EDD29_5265 [Actinocorallia herbida]|uniref:Uncharacterized protein n=1 Tax=Actinocorallia herbida TaxID=58109 RepID=A0A3N1D2A4_9ACTN|nr:hypothetical protein [Actinocorallia herbida]ROO87642.1 hypothetical protein EDD29_5265 [Actinocorallia herbida]